MEAIASRNPSRMIARCGSQEHRFSVSARGISEWQPAEIGRRRGAPPEPVGVVGGANSVMNADSRLVRFAIKSEQTEAMPANSIHKRIDGRLIRQIDRHAQMIDRDRIDPTEHGGRQCLQRFWRAADIRDHSNGRALLGQLRNIFDPVECLDDAPIEDRDPVADFFDFVQNMTIQKNRFALRFQAMDQIPNLMPRDGIEAVRRFVQNQQRGIVEQCLGETESLSHAFAVFGDTVFDTLVQADEFEQFAPPLPHRAERQAGKLPVVVHRGQGVMVTANAQIFGHITDVPPPPQCRRRDSPEWSPGHSCGG